MLQTQFSRLQNIAQQSSYRYNTIYLNQQRTTHFKNRLHQIQNEFDLVDFDKKGYLYRSEIENYLEKKYQWVNKKVLNELFNSIDWKKMDRGEAMYVNRQQFCQKYLQRQKQLFYQFTKLQSQQKWFNSLYTIYQQTANLRPAYYVSAQILNLQFYNNNFTEEFVNIDIRYQDHQEKLEFDITQNSYDITKPSYELILPAQENEFFLSYNFTNTKDHTIIYGNTYVSIDLKAGRILKEQDLSLEVRKNSVIVGRCKVALSLETRPQVIRQKLAEKSAKINQNLKEIKDVDMTLSELKQKEYEYIQFLWGIKHMPSEKIEEQQVTLIIVLRTVLIVLLGCLGIVVHVLGRCEPLSLICVFLMLKWRTYVILKVELFLMTWLIIAAMLLDGIWLVFSSHHVSQINYLNLASSMTITYFLLGVKVLFFFYLLAFQKPFANPNDKDLIIEKNNQLN